MADDVFADSSIQRRLLKLDVYDCAGYLTTAPLRSEESYGFADFFLCLVHGLDCYRAVFLRYTVLRGDVFVCAAGR